MAKAEKEFASYWSPAELKRREDRSRGYADAFDGIPERGDSQAYRDGYAACKRALANWTPRPKQSKDPKPESPQLEMF